MDTKRKIAVILFLSFFLTECIAAHATSKSKIDPLLTSAQCDEIYAKEKTPDVLKTLSPEQQKAIVTEINAAKERNGRQSLEAGEACASEFKNPLDRVDYEDQVFHNLMLRLRSRALMIFMRMPKS